MKVGKNLMNKTLQLDRTFKITFFFFFKDKFEKMKIKKIDRKKIIYTFNILPHISVKSPNFFNLISYDCPEIKTRS